MSVCIQFWTNNTLSCISLGLGVSSLTQNIEFVELIDLVSFCLNTEGALIIKIAKHTNRQLNWKT